MGHLVRRFTAEGQRDEDDVGAMARRVPLCMGGLYISTTHRITHVFPFVYTVGLAAFWGLIARPFSFVERQRSWAWKHEHALEPAPFYEHRLGD